MNHLDRTSIWSALICFPKAHTDLQSSGQVIWDGVAFQPMSRKGPVGDLINSPAGFSGTFDVVLVQSTGLLGYCFELLLQIARTYA